MRYQALCFAFTVLMTALASTAQAHDVSEISPVATYEKAAVGSLVVVDVREPDEWAETGIAFGAATIAMRDPQRNAKFHFLTKGNKQAPIALICRTGARSSHVAKALEKLGYTNVYSVTGGMVGSPTGLGWQRSGLPITPLKQQHLQ